AQPAGGAAVKVGVLQFFGWLDRSLPLDEVYRAAAVAGLYRGLVDGFVLDERDAAQTAEIEALGMRVLCADTLAASEPGRAALGAAVLGFGRSLRNPPAARP
ncbi:MAG TPA: 2-phospho-L-lactate transferase, partial [Candidatus Dormibacteraeota bacterium]